MNESMPPDLLDDDASRTAPGTTSAGDISDPASMGYSNNEVEVKNGVGKESASSGSLEAAAAKHGSDGVPKKSAYATEADIESAKPSEKLFFGDGIYLRVNNRGNKKTFYIRISLKGKSQQLPLGAYPETSLLQAREIAKAHQDRITKTRLEKAIKRFGKNLDQYAEFEGPDKSDEIYPSFSSIADAGQFIQNLWAYNESAEIRLAIWLQMLNPSRADELLDAEWSDFRDNKVWFTGKPKPTMNNRKNESLSAQFEFLSSQSLGVIDELYKLKLDDTRLFPTLARMKKSERNKAIAQAIEAIWTKYPLHLNAFQNFFITTACKGSYFTPEFIQSVIKHRSTKNSVYTGYCYDPQKWALMQWWGDELCLRIWKFGFASWKSTGI